MKARQYQKPSLGPIRGGTASSELQRMEFAQQEFRKDRVRVLRLCTFLDESGKITIGEGSVAPHARLRERTVLDKPWIATNTSVKGVQS